MLDLHNLLSVYLYVPLLIIALTGIYFSKPEWIDPVLSVVSIARQPGSSRACQGLQAWFLRVARTTPTQAVALARALLSISEIRLGCLSLKMGRCRTMASTSALPDNIGLEKGRPRYGLQRMSGSF